MTNLPSINVKKYKSTVKLGAKRASQVFVDKYTIYQGVFSYFT